MNKQELFVDTPQKLDKQSIIVGSSEMNDLIPELQQMLEQVPEPDAALKALERFIAASSDPAYQVSHMKRNPKYLRTLVELFSQSTFIADILCKYPEYGQWLLDEAPTDRSRTKEDLMGVVSTAFQDNKTFESRQLWMRRFTRREFVRIATRELIHHAPFESIVADISSLADAMIEAASIASGDALSDRYGVLVSDDNPEEIISFCILAMGKLGGYELNFSSDIDVIFIYSADGHTKPESPRQATTEEYFRKRCELIIKCLSEHTSEGHVFRVDTRLRPFGKSGPIACSLESAIEYYTNYGRAWERQALIKARPCAGDITLGNMFLERLRHFIYPRYFDDATLEDIRNVKQQTEAIIASKSQTDREVKLGRGGIRDIEFTVQMLQLLHGGRWPDSRTTNTLQAIQALGERQRIRPFEAKTLSRNYIFLRGIEHRLQIEGGLQTHILPESKQELDRFARRLGYVSGEAFMNVFKERTQETRAILEQFLATKGDGNLWVIELLEPESECTAGLEKLRTMGFSDPERARKELLQLANGPENAPYTRDTAQQFAAITPLLLEALRQTPDPDAVLLRFSQIISLLPIPATLYGLLKYHPRLSQYLVTLISNSDYFSEMLVRNISLLDSLGFPGYLDFPTSRQELQNLCSEYQRAANPEPALYRVRDGEILKIALRDLLLNISVAEVGDELSQLAEVIIESTLKTAREEIAQRYGYSNLGFAVLALGKLGGKEMGYGSDLDLLFVYEDESALQQGIKTSLTEYYGAIASRVLKRLKEPTRYGILYDVDARLRPDGSKGALAIPLQRLAQYYREEAHPWEKLALMKVRAVAGDNEFMSHVEKTARQLAFNLSLDDTLIKEQENMRRKLAQTAGPLDLKRREGGIAEIEIAVRLMQVRFVRQYPELERGGVFGALAILRSKDLISEENYETLYTAYGFFRKVLNRTRMMRGSSSSYLSESPETLRRLSQSLGIEGEIKSHIENLAKKVHAVYIHTIGSILRDRY